MAVGIWLVGRGSEVVAACAPADGFGTVWPTGFVGASLASAALSDRGMLGPDWDCAASKVNCLDRRAPIFGAVVGVVGAGVGVTAGWNRDRDAYPKPLTDPARGTAALACNKASVGVMVCAGVVELYRFIKEPGADFATIGGLFVGGA